MNAIFIHDMFTHNVNVGVFLNALWTSDVFNSQWVYQKVTPFKSGSNCVWRWSWCQLAFLLRLIPFPLTSHLPCYIFFLPSSISSLFSEHDQALYLSMVVSRVKSTFTDTSDSKQSSVGLPLSLTWNNTLLEPKIASYYFGGHSICCCIFTRL
jgi:hypothetical protein